MKANQLYIFEAPNLTGHGALRSDLSASGIGQTRRALDRKCVIVEAVMSIGPSLDHMGISINGDTQ